MRPAEPIASGRCNDAPKSVTSSWAEQVWLANKLRIALLQTPTWHPAKLLSPRYSVMKLKVR